MNSEVARNFFMVCSIINYCLLILWCALFVFARDPMKALNDWVFRRKVENFDTLNYAGIGLYKIGIILFNIVPWITLSIMR